MTGKIKTMTAKQRAALHCYNLHVRAWKTIKSSDSIGINTLLAMFQLNQTGYALVDFGLAADTRRPHTTANLLAEGG